MNLLFLDFECANTYRYDSICWAGLVFSDETCSVLKTRNILIDPQVKKFHTGTDICLPFSTDDLKAYPDFSIAGPEILAAIKAADYVIGHSVHNDIAMLLSACKRHKLECPVFRYLDTNALYHATQEKFGEISLSALAEIYAVPLSAHDPLDDARATCDIYRKIMQQSGHSFDELLKTYQITSGLVKKQLVTKITYAAIPPKTLYKLQKINRFYTYILNASVPVQTEGRFSGRKIAFDKQLIADFDLETVAEKLLSEGARIVDDKKFASVYVTQKQDASKGKLEFDALLKYLYPNEKHNKVKSQKKDRAYARLKRGVASNSTL